MLVLFSSSSFVLLFFVILLIVNVVFFATALLEEPPSERIKLRGVYNREQNPAKPWVDQNDRTIFVAIAAFRDIECPLSVRDMFLKATNPRRLFLGIIEQNEPGDPTCVPPEFYACSNPDFCPLDNIRRRVLVSRRGKGPCFGRYVSMLLYRGENYYMMMDSHNMFVLNWDLKSIAQLQRARTSRPVVSNYPNGWDKNGQSYESHGNVIVMCNGHYVAMGYVRMDGRWMNRQIEPRMQPYSAGGYLFGDGVLVHDVPFDPHLDFLFDGEEILYSARMYTHGFDIFTPGESVLFHDYNRHKGIRYWTVQNSIPGNEGWHDQVTISQHRAQLMMQLPKANSTLPMVDPNVKEPRVHREFKKYTIGTRRTMDEYNTFAGQDPIKQKASEALCASLERQLMKSGH